MSPNAIATLVILSVLTLVATVVLAVCMRRVGRTWTQTTQGHHVPVLMQWLITGVLSVVLLNIALDPPFPISWNEPIRCTVQTCAWEYYYVLLIITVTLLALAALSIVLVLTCIVMISFVLRPNKRPKTMVELSPAHSARRQTDNHV